MEQELQDIEGLRALSKAIASDTQGEAEQVVADARRRAAARQQEAEAEAARIRREILTRTQTEIDQLRQQAQATARLEAQAVRLRRREKLIDLAFQQAMQALGRLQERADYDTILSNLIRDAVEQLGRPAEAIVHVAEPDQARLQEEALVRLAERWEGRVQLRLGAPAPIAGGVIVESADGHRRYDNSFAARLARERSRLRSGVYQILQGER